MTNGGTPNLAVALGDDAPITAAYDVQVKALGGTAVEVDFKGLAGRTPSTAGDYVAIWQSQGVLPWGKPPLNTQVITNTSPDGSAVFSELKLASLPYVLAYSVGSDAAGKNIVAVVPVAVGGNVGLIQVITLTTAYVGSTSLALGYTAPPGCKPKTFGHSVVLVGGQAYLPNTNPSPIAKTLPTDNPTDIASFNNVTMVVGQWYTAAYLAGPEPTNVAATVTFQVADS